jgi:hypothetical protein
VRLPASWAGDLHRTVVVRYSHQLALLPLPVALLALERLLGGEDIRNQLFVRHAGSVRRRLGQCPYARSRFNREPAS